MRPEGTTEYGTTQTRPDKTSVVDLRTLLRIQLFYLNADPDSDPGSQTNADLSWSGFWSDKSFTFSWKVSSSFGGTKAFLKGWNSGLIVNFAQFSCSWIRIRIPQYRCGSNGDLCGSGSPPPTKLCQNKKSIEPNNKPWRGQNWLLSPLPTSWTWGRQEKQSSHHQAKKNNDLRKASSLKKFPTYIGLAWRCNVALSPVELLHCPVNRCSFRDWYGRIITGKTNEITAPTRSTKRLSNCFKKVFLH